MALVTKDEVKQYLKLDMGTTEDEMLDQLIAAAQKELELDHGWEVEYSATPRVEIHSGEGERFLFLKAHPIVSVTEVKVNGNVIASDQYTVKKAPAVLVGPWECGEDNIEVTYTAGYFTGTGTPPAGVKVLPADLKQECLERVAFLYENRRGRR